MKLPGDHLDYFQLVNMEGNLILYIENLIYCVFVDLIIAYIYRY